MTPRRDLGRLGIVGVVVFLVSSPRRSAVSYVEHLRLAVVLARTRGKRRGKGRVWVMRATRERRGVIARPEGPVDGDHSSVAPPLLLYPTHVPDRLKNI